MFCLFDVFTRILYALYDLFLITLLMILSSFYTLLGFGVSLFRYLKMKCYF